MRKYVSLKILRSIYFAIFDSYLSYCCLIWAQNRSTIQRILILQKKSVRIINFQPRNSYTSPLFKQKFILKFQGKICLENVLFVSKSLNNLTPSVLSTWFSFSSDQHNYETRVLHRVISQNYFIKQIDMGSIQSLQVLLSRGAKPKNN